MKIFKGFSLDEIISLLLIIIGIISVIISYIKNRKKGNTAGELAIIKKIPELIVKAEAMFGKGRGIDKLQYVITELRVYALENKIKVDNEFLEAQVNSMVEVTKNVNVVVNNENTPLQETTNTSNITTSPESEQNNATNIEII